MSDFFKKKIHCFHRAMPTLHCKGIFFIRQQCFFPPNLERRHAVPTMMNDSGIRLSHEKRNEWQWCYCKKKVNRPKIVITGILKFYEDTVFYPLPNTPGWLRKTIPWLNQMIQCLSVVERFVTATVIAWQVIEEIGMKMSSHTATSRLYDAGFHLHSATIKFLIK